MRSWPQEERCISGFDANLASLRRECYWGDDELDIQVVDLADATCPVQATLGRLVVEETAS